MTVLLVDVRTKEEYDEHHAIDAVNIPVEEIYDGQLGMLGDVEKDSFIHLYCRSGGRAERAKEMLLSLGYMNVENLGGLVDMESVCTL